MEEYFRFHNLVSSKRESSFVNFNDENVYPSISDKLLTTAINFESSHTNIANKSCQ